MIDPDKFIDRYFSTVERIKNKWLRRGTFVVTYLPFACVSGVIALAFFCQLIVMTAPATTMQSKVK